jgi:hypothetical protein
MKGIRDIQLFLSGYVYETAGNIEGCGPCETLSLLTNKKSHDEYYLLRYKAV